MKNIIKEKPHPYFNQLMSILIKNGYTEEMASELIANVVIEEMNADELITCLSTIIEKVKKWKVDNDFTC